jgi:subtilisin family serine protease
MRKYAVLAPAMFAVVACQDSTSPAPTTVMPDRVNAARNAARNDYIVTFRDDEADPEGQANGLVKTQGGSLRHVYRYALKGFAVANLSDAAVAALQRNPHVARVERDGIVTVDGTQTPAPSWGLDRIDARTGTDGSYNYPTDGTGVTAYIIDTGINSASADFTGRLGTGADFVDADPPDDCHGHGTHVAGTVGGTTYGVAKKVTIVAVRVLDCFGNGSDADVIAGIDWVVGQHQAGQLAIANMSLGGDFMQSLNDAVQRATDDGIVMSVAAGNSAASACNYSPSSAGSAITVGATTLSNTLASYSNVGNCVDILAPGSAITSDWVGSATATNTISGTSMASPHVAGAAALYLSANPTASVTDVTNALVTNATSNAISLVPVGTPNKLLYVGFMSSGGATGSKPTATLSKTCSGFTCTFTLTSSGGTSAPVWHFINGAVQGSNGTTQYSVKYGPRTSGSVSVDVSNAAGTTTVSQSVTCNPKKCQ